MPIYSPQVSRILPGYAGHAISVAAQASLNPGDSIDLPTDALRNNTGETILIDALRWTADAQQRVVNPWQVKTPPLGLIGQAVSASISVNDNAITGGLVPLYSLGRPAGLDVESMISAIAILDPSQPMPFQSAILLLGSSCSGVWGFDHPISLAPGASIAMHLTSTGLLSLPILVSIAFTGRIGSGLPRSGWLPYVAAWNPPALDPQVPTATAPFVVSSTERDLVNRSGHPLHVSRFIGRLARLSIVGTNATINAENVFPSGGAAVSGLPVTNFFPGAVDSALSITMRDSDGNENIPFPVPFRQAFEPERKALECPHVLGPDAYYVAQLSLAVPAVLDQSIQPSIAMCGEYEV